MTIHFSLNIILLITGISIGLFVSVMLLSARSTRKANGYLAALVLVNVGSLIHNFLLDAGIYNQQQSLWFLPVILSLGIGPLLYLYVKRLIGLTPADKSKPWVHLLPMLLQCLFFVWAFLQPVGDKYNIYQNLYKPLVSPLQNTAVYVSVAVYIYFSLKAMADYRHKLGEFYSGSIAASLNWLQVLLAVVGCYYILSLLFLVITHSFNLAENYFPSDLIRCGIIFIIAWFNLRQPALEAVQQNLQSVSEDETDSSLLLTEVSSEKVPAAIVTQEDQKKPKDFNPELLKGIISLVSDEQLYLNEELTIADLAKKLGYSTRVISQTINNGLHKSFSTFINEYRVNLFIERKTSGKFDHLSILGLAYDCGFNSKSGFNRIYKDITGTTPGEAKQRL